MLVTVPAINFITGETETPTLPSTLTVHCIVSCQFSLVCVCTDEAQPTSTPKQPLEVIGAGVGGVALIVVTVAVCICCCCYCKKRRRRRRERGKDNKYMQKGTQPQDQGKRVSGRISSDLYTLFQSHYSRPRERHGLGEGSTVSVTVLLCVYTVMKHIVLSMQASRKRSPPSLLN